MKVWSAAANEMKRQGNGTALDKFWPQVDSQAVINLHSPTKKGKEKAIFLGVEESIQVEEQEEWQIRTPWKANEDSTISNARMEALEKTQQSTTTIVESLSTELSKTRMECNEVLVKAKEAIDSSKRAVDALLQHLQALDKEIKAYDKTVKDSEQATNYLGGQVQNIAGQISQLKNVPDVQMQAMQKILADTEKKMKEQEEEAEEKNKQAGELLDVAQEEAKKWLSFVDESNKRLASKNLERLSDSNSGNRNKRQKR
jgi:chromosome segregation ATPase